MNDLEFMNKFKPKTRCIKEFKYWIVCIREKQVTLGDAVILLKREILSIADMLPEEASEFPEVIKYYEDICIKKFGALRFNYLILMMKDNFVHYHAFPRYNRNINFFDIEWNDNEWPFGINIKNYIEISEEKLQEIKEYMIQDV